MTCVRIGAVGELCGADYSPRSLEEIWELVVSGNVIVDASNWSIGFDRQTAGKAFVQTFKYLGHESVGPDSTGGMCNRPDNSPAVIFLVKKSKLGSRSCACCKRIIHVPLRSHPH